MPKRKKRLKKGIESLKGRIKEHEIKREQAKLEGNIELEKYYIKEIKAKESAKERKKKQFER